MASAKEAYISDLISLLPAEVVTALQTTHRQGAAATKATWHTRFGSGPLTLRNAESLSESGDAAEVVIIVENIGLTWIKALRAFGIPPSFFASHARSPATDDKIWSSILPPTVHPYDNALKGVEGAQFWHVDCVIICQSSGRDAHVRNGCPCIPRGWVWSDKYGFNASTSISAWICKHAGKSVYIILVDEPIDFVSAHQRQTGSWPNTHLPLSKNRGGLVIPPLYNEKPSLHRSLESFLSHNWHFDAIFPSVSASTFWYLVATSSWEANLRRMNKLIKYVAFEEIRRPTIAINNRLHDLRRDLDTLQQQTSLTYDWVPANVVEELLARRMEKKTYIGLPKQMLERTLKDAAVLEKFLMDSFGLLLSSISVQEASISAIQSKRAQQLTALAFVYVPLSFVTGIFGMNVAEINGSSPSAWIPVVTLGIVLLLTASIFTIYSNRERLKTVLKR